MADVSAKDVAALRKITGAGMMDCKKALQESGGDQDAAADWLRKQGLGASNVVPKGGGGLVVHQAMAVAVRRDFVTCCGDPRHERRMTFRHPPQHEERGAHAVLRQQIEQPLGVAAHTALEPVPLAARNDSVEDADVEVVFDVHGHGIDDLRAHAGPSPPPTMPTAPVGATGTIQRRKR